MKLRNKKTGEIAEDTEILVILASMENVIPTYHSLTELNEEWEDYEPIDVEDNKTYTIAELYGEDE